MMAGPTRRAGAAPRAAGTVEHQRNADVGRARPVAPLTERAGLLALGRRLPAPGVPHLCSQSQLNRRVRAAEPLLRRLQTAVAASLTSSTPVYPFLDTTLIPDIHRVRAGRQG